MDFYVGVFIVLCYIFFTCFCFSLRVALGGNQGAGAAN